MAKFLPESTTEIICENQFREKKKISPQLQYDSLEHLAIDLYGGYGSF